MKRRLFWSATALIAYAYLIFPLIVVLRSRMRPVEVRSAPGTPRLSLVVAAHNERSAIGAKLDNLLSLSYPHDRLEIIIASDGSDDGTDDIVRGYEARGAVLLSLPRAGKAAALNAAAQRATGEVLAFSDANSVLAPDALLQLVAPFADPSVGGVAGDQRYTTDRGKTGLHGERQYWRFDRWLKAAESRAGDAISATGALYAVRRRLFQPVPAGVTDDFAVSTAVIAQGYRLVFAPDAVAYEPAARSSRGEFQRKVRIATRGLRAVILRRELLNPARHGFYALQLLSHKVLRRLVAVPLVVVAVTAPLLWRAGWIYRLATIGQGAFYGLAAIGILAPNTRLGRSRLCALPAYFSLVNLAVLLALENIVLGRTIDRWEPARSEGSRPSAHDRASATVDRAAVTRLRGDLTTPPSATIVVPVNAQGDLGNVWRLLGDLVGYRGPHTFEVVLVVNNYDASDPPASVADYQELGLNVMPVPNARRAGEAVGFSARMLGLMVAEAETAILFDADCRIENPTALLDWYVDQLREADVAYTHVAYYDLRSGASITVRIALHHLVRWIKRVILQIPTTRGSNYAVRRDYVLRLYDEGRLADEMNVGPTVKQRGGRVSYGSGRELEVHTSGRMFRGGWRQLPRYFLYRLRYNLRVLPGGVGVAERTGREADPVRRYVDNRPVREDRR